MAGCKVSALPSGSAYSTPPALPSCTYSRTSWKWNSPKFAPGYGWWHHAYQWKGLSRQLWAGGRRRSSHAPLHDASFLHLRGLGRAYPEPGGPQRSLWRVGGEHGWSAALVLQQLRRVRCVGHLRGPRREHRCGHRPGRHLPRSSQCGQDHRAAQRRGGHGGDAQGKGGDISEAWAVVVGLLLSTGPGSLSDPGPPCCPHSRTSWKGNSAKSIYRILDARGPDHPRVENLPDIA